MRRLVFAALLAVATASPAAAAWQYHEYWSEVDTWIMASELDITSAYQLSVNCSDMFTEIAYIAIDTDAAWDDSTSYAPEVLLTLAVDGTALEPLHGKFEQHSGKVAIVASELDDVSLRAAVAALRDAATSIEASFFDTSLTFTTQGSRPMVSRFLETCNGEPAF